VKIAFFSESYKPYLSGVTNSIETLKNALERLGHETLVFSPDYPGAPKEKGIYRFPSVPAPYPGYRLAIPLPGMFYNVLKNEKVDVIHSHSPYQLGLLSLAYANLLKKPFIFTMHTMLGQYMHYIPLIPESVSGSITDKYIRSFCDHTSAVVAPTQKVQDQLRSIGVSSRIEIVPTGVDMQLAAKADPSGVRRAHGIPDGSKVLLFVGRLAKEKNIPFLFRVFSTVRSKIRDVHFLIAAGGPIESELKSMAPENVIFAGEVKYPKVLDYYAASDIFIFSSLSETQGLVLAEAMSCGLPQVAVDAEGVSNVVKDSVTGYLTPNSEQDFAARVIELLESDQAREKMSVASKEVARSAYSSEVFAAKIELIYKSVI